MKSKNNLSLFLKYQLQENKILILLNFVLFIIIMLSLNLSIFDVAYNFKAGDIAPFKVVASKNLNYIDSVATKKRREAAKKEVIPVFDLDMSIYESKVMILEELFGVVLDNKLSADEKKEKAQSILGNLLEEKKLEDFDYKNLFRYGKRSGFLERMKSLLYGFYQRGLYKPMQGGYNLGNYAKKLVPVRIIEEKTPRRGFKRFNNYLYSDISYFEFYSLLQKKLGNRKPTKLIVDILYLLLDDNLYVNAIYTQQEIDTRIKRIQPVSRSIKEDEVIIRKGDKINQLTLDKVKALKVSKRKGFIKKLIFSFVLAVFMLAAFNLSLRIIYPKIFGDHKKLTLFFIFIIFNVLLLYLFFNLLSYLSFPIGLIFPLGFSVYIISITMERRLAFLMVLITALLLIAFVVVYRSDTIYSVFYILALGVLMSLSAANIQRRDQIIRNAIYMAFPYLALTAVYIFYFPAYVDADEMGLAFLWSALSPVLSAVMAIGLIPVFESVFNMITPFRLMELSNLSNKILSDMHLLAPGTYHHCLLVSHLVESACKEIDANPLLGRVGALYHDIGKLSNPKYFAENMEFGDYSIHEEISPQFSASILKSHTLEGIRMARELGLPDEVIRFIPEHHGNSLMEFFYHKAKEQLAEGEEVDEAMFRYTGKRPHSKETAILMLADGIEAAVRSLKSKRYDLIEEKIAQIINKRINDGLLSKSPLTLRDIKKVELAFRKLMFAYYHVRPSYPDDKKNENKNDL